MQNAKPEHSKANSSTKSAAPSNKPVATTKKASVEKSAGKATKPVATKAGKTAKTEKAPAKAEKAATKSAVKKKATITKATVPKKTSSAKVEKKKQVCLCQLLNIHISNIIPSASSQSSYCHEGEEGHFHSEGVYVW
jgi:hypothetical protein